MIKAPASPRRGSDESTHTLRAQCLLTSHPEWLESLIEEIERYQCTIRECLVIHNASKGTFTLPQAHECLIQFYPFMETFPHWVSLNIEKASDPATRTILKRYSRIAKWHARQWHQMAEGFGVCRQRLFETPIRLKVEALNRYMWTVNRRQSLAEGVMVLGYAFGFVAQAIAPSLIDGFRQYEQRKDVSLTKSAYAWLRSHAQSDGVFSLASLEITKRHVSTRFEQDVVKVAVIRGLELLLMAIEECGTEYDPCDTYWRAHHTAA